MTEFAAADTLDFFGQPVAPHVPPELIRKIDLFHSPGMDRDPFVIVDKLHREPRIVYNLQNPIFGQSWLPTRAKEIRYIVGNPQLFSSDHQAGFSKLIGEAWRLACVEMDAPDHTRFRALMQPWVSPPAVERMSQAVRDLAVSLIEEILAKGTCDFVSDYALRFPIAIFLELMGLPHELKDDFLYWTRQVLHEPNIAVKTQGAQSITNYLRELMADRRRNPRNDIATWSVQAKFDGSPLTDDQIMGIYFVLFTGGLDTVTSTLSFLFKHLAMHPEQQEELRAHPEKLHRAANEYLRYSSPVTAQRCVREDLELANVHMKKGDWVTILYSLASRDPEEFASPTTVDFERQNNRHFGFAFGPHFCLGSHLAIREMVITLEEWLKRVPTFRIEEHTEPVAHGGIVFGMDTLRLAWN